MEELAFIISRSQPNLLAFNNTSVSVGDCRPLDFLSWVELLTVSLPWQLALDFPVLVKLTRRREAFRLDPPQIV